MILLLLGAVGWFSPTMASTRRSWKADRAAVPREIVLPVSSAATEICVQGTSISGTSRVAVIDGRVVTMGQRIQWSGKTFSVMDIEPESVRLREVDGHDRQTAQDGTPALQ